MHVWNVLVYYFAWPYGNVYGNLWAIVPTGILAGIWGRAKLLKWHRANLRRDAARHEELLHHLRKVTPVPKDAPEP